MTPGCRRGASKTAQSTQAGTGEHPFSLLKDIPLCGGTGHGLEQDRSICALCCEAWEPPEQQGLLQSSHKLRVPLAASPSLPLWGADVLPRNSSQEILTLHTEISATSIAAWGWSKPLSYVSMERNKNIFWVPWKNPFASTALRLPIPWALPPL